MPALQTTREESPGAFDLNDSVARALAGCEAAFSEIASHFFPRLVQLVRPRLHSHSFMDAEDVAQESLARAFENLNRFDSRFRFSTWLYTIALRIAADHNRGSRRRSALIATHREQVAQRQTLGNLSTAVENSDSADAIWQTARSVLTEAHFTALWLRFAEDLSVEEIAQVMRKTKVGVRVLLHRARLRMLKVMDMEDAESNSRSTAKETWV